MICYLSQESGLYAPLICRLCPVKDGMVNRSWFISELIGLDDP